MLGRPFILGWFLNIGVTGVMEGPQALGTEELGQLGRGGHCFLLHSVGSVILRFLPPNMCLCVELFSTFLNTVVLYSEMYIKHL